MSPDKGIEWVSKEIWENLCDQQHTKGTEEDENPGREITVADGTLKANV